MKSLRHRWCSVVALGREIARGESGAMDIKKIIMTVILAFVGIMFIIQISQLLETEVAAFKLIVPTPNAFVIAMLEMSEWMLPIGAIIGIFFGIFMLFRSKNK